MSPSLSWHEIMGKKNSPTVFGSSGNTICDCLRYHEIPSVCSNEILRHFVMFSDIEGLGSLNQRGCGSLAGKGLVSQNVFHSHHSHNSPQTSTYTHKFPIYFRISILGRTLMMETLMTEMAQTLNIHQIMHILFLFSQNIRNLITGLYTYIEMFMGIFA